MANDDANLTFLYKLRADIDGRIKQMEGAAKASAPPPHVPNPHWKRNDGTNHLSEEGTRVLFARFDAGATVTEAAHYMGITPSAASYQRARWAKIRGRTKTAA